jgi:hypothetical protein
MGDDGCSRTMGKVKLAVVRDRDMIEMSKIMDM